MHKSDCIHFGVESISEVEIEVMEVKIAAKFRNCELSYRIHTKSRKNSS